MQVKEKAYAKINLTLDVLGKRTDGYHDLASIMQTIDLADQLFFSAREEGIVLEVSGADIPTDERNLAYQAAKLLQDKVGVKKGVRIFIEKKIPVMAGLAGGSADAAATLRGLNKLWQLQLSDQALWQLATALGSDVAFCLKGGTSLAEGRGERLTPLALAQPIWLLLVKPFLSVSTKDVYQSLDLKKIEKRPNNGGMIAALRSGNLAEIATHLENVLESVTFRKYPVLQDYKQKLQEQGALGVLMSGSGSTIFALTANKEEAENLMKKFTEPMEAVRVTRMRSGLEED